MPKIINKKYWPIYLVSVIKVSTTKFWTKISDLQKSSCIDLEIVMRFRHV